MRKRQSTVAIVFETHATTTDDARWLASGWSDVRLAAAGRRQARELGERRGSEELAAVFTSDLPCAIETARLAFTDRGVPVFHDWRLRGCDYGELVGVPVAQVEATRSQHLYDPYPGGESYADVVARVRRFLQDVPLRFVDRRVALVGHTETKWALDHVLEGTPLAELVEAGFHWQPGWLYTLHVDS